MGLFDDYFDPQQFQDSGGLLGRLLSLQQQQGQYQPGGVPGSEIPTDGQTPSVAQAAVPLPTPRPTLPSDGPIPTGPQAPDSGPTQNISIGDYQMPQFGSANVSQATQQAPDIGDRLNAGFQSWAHTPVGNPVAAFANAITGLSTGQRTDMAGAASPPTPSQTPAQPPGLNASLGDRLSAGLQSWATTPAGNPIAALANGFTGFGSGQPTASSVNAPKSPGSQLEALEPSLGNQGAMLTTVDPQARAKLIAQLLSRRAAPAKPPEQPRWPMNPIQR